MDIFWLFIRWIHVIAAVVWIGGNLILAMVIVPHFRQNLPPVQRIQILTLIGKRFEPIVWLCVLILVFTGIVNIFNSVDLSATNEPLFVGTFMRTLGIKLLLFFILLILTGLHSIFYGPKLSKAIEDLDPETEELPANVNSIRKQMAIVSSAMGVVSLLIILAAVALRMGI